MENEDYLSGHLMIYPSKNSKFARRYAIQRFFEFVQQKSILECTHKDFLDYFQSLRDNPKKAIATKKLDWTCLQAFVKYVQESEDIWLNFPTRATARWNGCMNAPESKVKDIVLDAPGVQNFLDACLQADMMYGTLLSLAADSGARISEVCTIHLDDLHLDERYFETGREIDAFKAGKLITYFFSERVQRLLRRYLIAHDNSPAAKGNIFLFPGNLGGYIKRITVEIFMTKHRGVIPITPHTLRRTINTLRKTKFNCDVETRKVLLNQTSKDVNINHYTKLSIKEKRDIFDQYYPY